MMGFQLFKDVLCNEPLFDNLGNETTAFKTFCLVFKRMIITTLIIQHFKVWYGIVSAAKLIRQRIFVTDAEFQLPRLEI